MEFHQSKREKHKPQSHWCDFPYQRACTLFFRRQQRPCISELYDRIKRAFVGAERKRTEEISRFTSHTSEAFDGAKAETNGAIAKPILFLE